VDVKRIYNWHFSITNQQCSQHRQHWRDVRAVTAEGKEKWGQTHTLGEQNGNQGWKQKVWRWNQEKQTRNQKHHPMPANAYRQFIVSVYEWKGDVPSQWGRVVFGLLRQNISFSLTKCKTKTKMKIKWWRN